jgi:hypothetical protein
MLYWSHQQKKDLSEAALTRKKGGRAMTSKKDRILVAVAALGFLAAFLAGTMTTLIPSFHRLLQNPLAFVLVVLVALATSAALLLWAWQPGHRDRVAYVLAIMGAALLVVSANVVAPTIGWWGGTYLQKAPLLVLAVLTGVGVMGGFALLLAGYRWLANRSPKLALLVSGLILLVLFPPAVILGDQFALRSGMLAFGGGYTIWHDLLVGEGFFLALILLYEILRRRLGVPQAPHSEDGTRR